MQYFQGLAIIFLLLLCTACSQVSDSKKNDSLNDSLDDDYSNPREMNDDPNKFAMNDPNSLNYDRVKFIADSLKRKFELEKNGLLKLSYEEINEGRTIWVSYFDASFKLKYFERIVRYDENVETSTIEVHNPEGIILWYQIDQQGYNSNVTIWLKPHIYQKIFDFETNKFNYSIKEGEVEKQFKLKDQQLAYKLITATDNTQVQISTKLEDIPKEEFLFDADSSCYRITVQKGEKGEFDSFWSELRIDSAFFVHLFGGI